MSEEKQHVKITGGPNAPHDVQVFIDGHEIRYLCSIRLDIAADMFPKLTLEIEPSVLEFDGPAEVLAELVGQAEKKALQLGPKMLIQESDLDRVEWKEKKPSWASIDDVIDAALALRKEMEQKGASND